MSTNLMSFGASFQGPFAGADVEARATLFGASLFGVPEGVERWYEVFIHFSREDDAAPTAATPELIAQVFGEDLGMAGELPLAQLSERDPETFMYAHIIMAGDFRMAKRVTTLAYIDARLLPAKPQTSTSTAPATRARPSP